ncbi:MAG: hypothetical protein ACRD30_02940 [Bryobacteraceae bacterium]
MAQVSIPGTSQQKGRVPDELVRQELNRILSSHEFHSSKRSQDFFRYVVEHTLDGNADLLKERTIGIDVFGRSTSYEPSEDATVRVKAGEVRKRLGLYYAGQGANNPVRIEVPGGTYIPEFRWTERPAEVVQEAAPAKIEAQHKKFPRLIPIAAALVAMAIAGVWLVRAKTPAALDQFWSPVLNGALPATICVAYVPVYGLNGPDADPARAQNFVLLTDQFVGGGDLLASARLSAMLARMRHPYTLRIGNNVSFEDLRSGPAILVGYSYTRWEEISRPLRYFIKVSGTRAGITDYGKPTDWNIPNLPADRRTDEDYAIVTRVFHPDTHAMLVEIAGITQYGTEAAAEFVTNPGLLAEGLRHAAGDWQKKNLQIVLHVKVISGTPSSPALVGTYLW